MQDELGNKQFYITPSHPCSYLPHRDANTLFLDPRETITPDVYQALTEQGFRRSGGHLYRPHCRTCQACIPSRVPVASFKAKRRQKRVLTRNEDLRIEIKPAAFSTATLRPLRPIHCRTPRRWRYVSTLRRSVSLVSALSVVGHAFCLQLPRSESYCCCRNGPTARRPVCHLHVFRAHRVPPQPRESGAFCSRSSCLGSSACPTCILATGFGIQQRCATRPTIVR